MNSIYEQLAEECFTGQGISNDYVIAIPTFNRVEGCYKKTLTMLKENKVPKERIYIFVHNDEQKKLYADGLPAGSYGKIVATHLNKGLAGQRNFIVDYFKLNQYILSLDDDITKIMKLQGNKLVPTYTLPSIIKRGFELCKANGYTLWGLYPSPNAFYMEGQKEYTTDLRFIVGAFMGFINKRRKANGDLKIRQDYDLSIQAYLKDGGLIRFNTLVAKYAIYTKTGGVGQGQSERMKQLKRETKILMNMYPNIVKHNTQREGEILLRRDVNNEKEKEKEKVIEGGKLSSSIIEKDDGVFVDKIQLTPTIKALQKKIVSLLDEISIPQVKSGFTYTGSKQRGEVVGSKGMTFNFGGGRRMFRSVGEFKANKEHPELFKALVKYSNEILPTGFPYSIITVNKNLKAKKHKDGGNDGRSCITFLGDYTGGGLYVYDERDKPTLYNSHNVVISFDGSKFAHKTQEFTGDRYAFIFYEQKNKFKIRGVPMVGKGVGEEDIEPKIY